ncbi:MAG: CHAP domain-containing protein [Pseudoflavonifractor sp.]
MTEQELREMVVFTATKYLGCNGDDGSHHKIIDIYNAHKPLPRGYPVKYTDAWCATFVSVVHILCGTIGIAPAECGCEPMIGLYKRLGRWQENEACTPRPGDTVFYDWQDKGVGDDVGAADHVGIVVSVTGGTLKVIEGNKGNAVGYRILAVNGRYIRGYGLPNYTAMATPEVKKEDEEMQIYKTLNDVPACYRPTIEKLMVAKALAGYSDPDPTKLTDNVINVSEDYCRVMVTLDRLNKL